MFYFRLKSQKWETRLSTLSGVALDRFFDDKYWWRIELEFKWLDTGSMPKLRAFTFLEVFIERVVWICVWRVHARDRLDVPGGGIETSGERVRAFSASRTKTFAASIVAIHHVAFFFILLDNWQNVRFRELQKSFVQIGLYKLYGNCTESHLSRFLNPEAMNLWRD